MTHVRTQIRNAFKGLLDVALPDHRVFASRKYNINAKHLPIVDMKFQNENSEFTTMSDVQSRTASLYIRFTHAADEGDMDDILDSVAVTAEHAIEAAGRMGGMLTDIALMQTNFTDSADGDTALAELVLRYDVMYRVSAGNVETAKD